MDAHTRSLRKKSGGKTRPKRKKKKRELGGEFSETTPGETSTRRRNTEGKTQKISMKTAGSVSVATEDGDVEEADIESILENPANPDFVRRNLITKGTIIQTSKGKARVTSRPGQDGTVNAELVDEE